MQKKLDEQEETKFQVVLFATGIVFGLVLAGLEAVLNNWWNYIPMVMAALFLIGLWVWHNRLSASIDTLKGLLKESEEEN